MTRMERRLLTTALLFGLLTLGVIGARGGLGVAFWRTPAAQAHSGTFYGATETWLATAAAEWPQRGNNWCGPANIEVIANYTYQLLGGQYDTPFLTGGQQRIVSDLDSTAAVCGPSVGELLTADQTLERHQVDARLGAEESRA
jgi:hypothetical protein